MAHVQNGITDVMESVRPVGRPRTAKWITVELSRRVKDRLFQMHKSQVDLAKAVEMPVDSLRG